MLRRNLINRQAQKTPVGLQTCFAALATVASAVSGCAVSQQQTPGSATVPLPPVASDGAEATASPTPIVPASYQQENAAEREAIPQPLADAPVPPISSPSDAPVIIGSTPTDQPEQIELDTLIATALTSHPRIIAARQRVAAAANRVPQARALPDPMFSNTFWPFHDHALQTAGGRIGNQMSLTQQVPWPAKLHARAAVAAREIEIARAEVAEAEREIVEAVRLAYYELWLTQAAIRILDENRGIVRDLIAVAEARYRAGGSQQDVLRAELEADRLEDQLITLQQQREQARADLGALVQQPISFLPAALDELDFADARLRLQDLVSRAERCNPTLQGLAAEIARDRARETVACLQQYPDLQFGVHWGLVSDDDDVLSPVANGHDNASFTVGVTLPIWKEKINAGIREAAANRSSTANLREAERDQIAGQIRRLVAAAEAAIEQRQLFEERLIPRTEQTLRLAMADYQGNRTDFFNVVDLYQEVLSYQLQLARIESTLASTLARLDRVVGCAEPQLAPTAATTDH